jgi:hypothetical protein
MKAGEAVVWIGFAVQLYGLWDWLEPPHAGPHAMIVGTVAIVAGGVWHYLARQKP